MRFAVRSTAVTALLALATYGLAVPGSAAMAAPASADVNASNGAGASSDVTEMPDAFSARGAAARLGHRVEITDSRTPGTSTYANADGTLTLESSTYDRNLAGDDGTLHPVDDTLAQSADGTWAAGLNALRPRFA